MNEVTITTAPQASLSTPLYARWLNQYTGTADDFYQFMTTPSADRDDFLASLNCKIEIVEGLGRTVYSPIVKPRL